MMMMMMDDGWRKLAACVWALYDGRWMMYDLRTYDDEDDGDGADDDADAYVYDYDNDADGDASTSSRG